MHVYDLYDPSGIPIGHVELNDDGLNGIEIHWDSCSIRPTVMKKPGETWKVHSFMLGLIATEQKDEVV